MDLTINAGSVSASKKMPVEIGMQSRGLTISSGPKK